MKEERLFFNHIREAWAVLRNWWEDWQDVRDAKRSLRDPRRSISWEEYKRQLVAEELSKGDQEMCGHPEMFIPKPPPAPILRLCRCGQNAACPVCGFGVDAHPCKCSEMIA